MLLANRRASGFFQRGAFALDEEKCAAYKMRNAVRTNESQWVAFVFFFSFPRMVETCACVQKALRNVCRKLRPRITSHYPFPSTAHIVYRFPDENGNCYFLANIFTSLET